MSATTIIALVLGLLAGLAGAFLLLKISAGKNRLNEDLIIERLNERLKDSMGSVSFEALSKFHELANDTFQKDRATTHQELDAKKGLIDQQLKEMSQKLEGVQRLMNNIEADRKQQFGALDNGLKSQIQQTASLLNTTQALREALASAKVRGQWGERMADDVLKMAGFIENINYLKQKTIEGAGSRPDFTFLLPRDLTMNMDAKFPLDNYMRYLEAQNEPDKDKARADFMRDIKLKVKEVTSREYINPQQNTVDYVLLFIPNEQVYAFIHEQDPGILDVALKSKVIFCSPITLFAVLAVVRQSIETFNLENTSKEVLSLIGAFEKQWQEFLKKLDTVGQRIGAAQKEYEMLAGTRKRALERPLNKIEEIRKQRGLPATTFDEDALALGAAADGAGNGHGNAGAGMLDGEIIDYEKLS